MDSYSTNFDSGGSVNVTLDTANDHVDLVLDNPYYAYEGYFCFRLDGVAGETISFDITNRANTRMPTNFRLVYASDITSDTWNRMPETVGGGWTHTFTEDSVYIADCWAYPYHKTVSRIQDLEAQYPTYVSSDLIGQSAEGRDMYAMRITDPSVSDSEKLHFVNITRQHPGEVWGAWQMKHLIDEVIDRYVNGSGFDEDFVWHFLPHANPDGLYRAHQRHDSVGNDFNREWDTAGPIEVDNMRSYMSSAIPAGQIFWGFDFHTSTAVSGYNAVFYETRAVNSEKLAVIQNIADANLSYTSSTSGSNYTDRGRSWIYDELGGTVIVTESSQYYQYTHAELENELIAYLDYALTLAGDPDPPSTGGAVHQNGQLLLHDGQILVL